MPDRKVSMDVMVGRIDERTQIILDSLEKVENRLTVIEQQDCPHHPAMVREIANLRLNQETITKDSAIEDEKIRSMILVNSAKTSGIISVLALTLNYIFNMVK